ncbi:MAG: GIY-YIG nuclease family protein [Minisyncoccia bacterium]|jgi:excinuclease ABC subunit C
MTLEQFKKRMSTIPDSPGVYFFLDARKKILYIGKATSLRSRVRSYFAPDLARARGPLIVDMVKKATSVEWQATDSVLEALILEANLIKRHKPKHNTDLKDDKSWNYVVITKEDFPRILLVRGKELEGWEKAFSLRRDKRETPARETFFHPYSHVFGPFPHDTQLKEALKIIRKIFPYRDTCTPHTKACFNAALGLCPGVCLPAQAGSGAINKTEYRNIVRRIVMLFQGKKSELVKSLERDMKMLAKAERFEEAAKLRGQLFALRHIQDVSLIKEEFRRLPSHSLGEGGRIEAYDAAHLGGSAMVGVMTVVENGAALKNEYRKFRIKSAKAGDDIGALREMLLRRLAHDEWLLPRLIVVDGGAAQLNAAHKMFAEYGVRIPIVGVTKDDKHRARAIQGDRGVISGHEHDILLANAEAHRFAIAYHRKLRSKEMGL